MAQQTALIPGYGFVVVDTAQTALIPGIGFVNLDGTAPSVPATINITSGFGLSTALGEPIVSAAATLTPSALTGLTASLGTPTVTTSSVFTVIADVKARLGLRAVNDFTAERDVTLAVAAELSGSVQAGLPIPKNVTTFIRARYGLRAVNTASVARTISATAKLGMRARFTHSANITGTGTNVTRSVSAVLGLRARPVAVPEKYVSAVASLGIFGSVIATTSQTGTGGTGGGTGELTQTSIENLINQLVNRLDTAPPTGLVTAVAQETIQEYRNDPVEVGPNGEVLTRVEQERLVVAATAGESFGMQAPQGAFIPEAGTTRGYYNTFKNKVRITTVSDGTPNRVIQSKDTSE